MFADQKQQQSSPPQVICVTGAKGGIGKTNVSINLGIATQRLGRQVMIFDADLSLANVDVMLGLSPKRNLANVINHECDLEDIIITEKHGMKVIPASSGVQKLCELNEQEHAGIIGAFNEIASHTDLLIVDTASGVSDQVTHFIRACNEVIVVVCNEPGSITDAYAQIKIMSQEYSINRFHILSNMVKSQHEGKLLFNKLKKTADQFLEVTIDYIGHIPYDEHIRLAIQQQKSVLDIYPHAKASESFEKLARVITQWPVSQKRLGMLQFFFESYVLQSEPVQEVFA